MDAAKSRPGPFWFDSSKSLSNNEGLEQGVKQPTDSMQAYAEIGHKLSHRK